MTHVQKHFVLGHCLLILYISLFLTFIFILSYSSEQSLNFLLQHFSCYFHLKMMCSVIFLICRILWLKASAKWRNVNANVPLLIVNPQRTPKVIAVNGCIMQHYRLPPSIMGAHQRERAKQHQHPRQTSIHSHMTPIPALAENGLLSVTLCIATILLQELETLTPGHKTAETFQSIHHFTNVHSKNHSGVI